MLSGGPSSNLLRPCARAGPAAGFSGVAQFAAGGSAVSLGMSAEALRHLQRVDLELTVKIAAARPYAGSGR